MMYPKEKRARMNSGMNRVAATARPAAGQNMGLLGVLLWSTAVSDTQFRVRKARSSSARMAPRLALRGKAWFIGSVRSFGSGAADLKSLTHSRQDRVQGLQIESGTR